MEHLGGEDRGAERDDARAEHPARNRVESIVHAVRDLRDTRLRAADALVTGNCEPL
jgi:hypothetical protein